MHNNMHNNYDFSCCFSSDQNLDSKLSKEKLLKLSGMSEVQEFVKEADYSFYQALVEVLIPDVLRPIPSKILNINVALVTHASNYVKILSFMHV